jgi:hypothetical protein
MNKTSLIALAVLPVLALAMATTAGAAIDKEKTKIKLTHGGAEGVEGKVSSKEPKCEKRRKVSLYFLGDSGRELIAKTRTDANGDFAIHASLLAGQYQAAVAEKDIGDNLVCKAGVSISYQF